MCANLPSESLTNPLLVNDKENTANWRQFEQNPHDRVPVDPENEKRKKHIKVKVTKFPHLSSGATEN
jgi:hypothetical protein